MKISFKFSEVRFEESVYMKVETMYPLRGISQWEPGGLQDASIAGIEPTGSLTRARSRHPLIQADRWIPPPASLTPQRRYPSR